MGINVEKKNNKLVTYKEENKQVSRRFLFNKSQCQKTAVQCFPASEGKDACLKNPCSSNALDI